MTVEQEANAAPIIKTPELNEDKMVPRRITIGLIARVRAELWSLVDVSKLSLTDVVNRAVSVYYLVTAHQAAGYELVFRHRETGRERVVEIL